MSKCKNADQSEVVETTMIDVVPIAKLKSNYSGPASAQIILESKDVSIDQEQLAAQIGAREGATIDYRIYLDPDEIDTSQTNLCLSRIDKNLKDGNPSIVTINAGTIGLADENTYVVVYGKIVLSSSKSFYQIEIPETEV